MVEGRVGDVVFVGVGEVFRVVDEAEEEDGAMVVVVVVVDVVEVRVGDGSCRRRPGMKENMMLFW